MKKFMIVIAITAALAVALATLFIGFNIRIQWQGKTLAEVNCLPLLEGDDRKPVVKERDDVLRKVDIGKNFYCQAEVDTGIKEVSEYDKGVRYTFNGVVDTLLVQEGKLDNATKTVKVGNTTFSITANGTAAENLSEYITIGKR